MKTHYDKKKKKWYKKGKVITVYFLALCEQGSCSHNHKNTEYQFNLSFNVITLEGCRYRKTHSRIKKTKLFLAVGISEKKGSGTMKRKWKIFTFALHLSVSLESFI